MTDEEKFLYREWCINEVLFQADPLREFSQFQNSHTVALARFMKQLRPHQSEEIKAQQLLEEAIASQNTDEVEFTLSVLPSLGHFPKHIALFVTLFQQQWHYRHEDMVRDLERFGAKTQIIEALKWATEVRLKYLEYNDSDALARKAIYAIARMNTTESRNTLNQIAKYSTGVRRDWARAKSERGKP